MLALCQHSAGALNRAHYCILKFQRQAFAMCQFGKVLIFKCLLLTLFRNLKSFFFIVKS
jgi:hypothetical protein